MLRLCKGKSNRGLNTIASSSGHIEQTLNSSTMFDKHGFLLCNGKDITYTNQQQGSQLCFYAFSWMGEIGAFWSKQSRCSHLFCFIARSAGSSSNCSLFLWPEGCHLGIRVAHFPDITGFFLVAVPGWVGAQFFMLLKVASQCRAHLPQMTKRRLALKPKTRKT